jgi:hypothetical protein
MQNPSKEEGDDAGTGTGTRAVAGWRGIWDYFLARGTRPSRKSRGTDNELARDDASGRSVWPHPMPVIAFWIDGAVHIVAGEGLERHTTSPQMDDASSPPAARRCHPWTSSSRAAPIRSPTATRFDTSPRCSAPAAGHFRPRETRSTVQRPNRRPAAVHDLPDRPVEGCSASPACTGWISSISQICRDRPAGTSAAADLDRGSRQRSSAD